MWIKIVFWNNFAKIMNFRIWKEYFYQLFPRIFFLLYFKEEMQWKQRMCWVSEIDEDIELPLDEEIKFFCELFFEILYLYCVYYLSSFVAFIRINVRNMFYFCQKLKFSLQKTRHFWFEQYLIQFHVNNMFE